eukprot:TRINITY_DN1630_c1_g1_i1.p1 TRINITY_DN1630_c1_g1~~TRINITY_DN1630_c1_g1_i1.p1  ORF type:complete len:729 (-),score=121.61 TRINITY_DN1630_c1_g1_i1:75-2261(-)
MTAVEEGNFAVIANVRLPLFSLPTPSPQKPYVCSSPPPSDSASRNETSSSSSSSTPKDLINAYDNTLFLSSSQERIDLIHRLLGVSTDVVEDELQTLHIIKTDEEQTTLPPLPRNLLLNIFSRLKSVRDLLRCALVCKSWASVLLSSETLWSSLYIKRWQPSPIFKRNSPCENNIKEMTATSDIVNEGGAVIYLRGEDYQREQTSTLLFEFERTSLSKSNTATANNPNNKRCYWIDAYRWRSQWESAWPYFFDSFSEDNFSPLNNVITENESSLEDHNDDSSESEDESDSYSTDRSAPVTEREEYPVENLEWKARCLDLIDAFTSTSTWLPPFLRYHSPNRPEIACPMRDESQLKVTFCRTYPLVLSHAELLELIWMRSVVPMLLVLQDSQRQILKHYYDPIRNIGTFIRCWVLTHVSTIKEQQVNIGQPLLRFVNILEKRYNLTHLATIGKLVSAVLRGEDPEIQEQLTEIFEHSVVSPPPLPERRIQILDISPLELADHINLLNGELLCNISDDEILYTTGPNIDNYLSFSQRITFAIQMQVKVAKTTEDKARIVLHWLETASNCIFRITNQQNHESLIAILEGLKACNLFSCGTPTIALLVSEDPSLSDGARRLLTALDETLLNEKEGRHWAEEPMATGQPYLHYYLTAIAAVVQDGIFCDEDGKGSKLGTWIDLNKMTQLRFVLGRILGYKDHIAVLKRESPRIREFLLTMGDEEAQDQDQDEA